MFLALCSICHPGTYGGNLYPGLLFLLTQFSIKVLWCGIFPRDHFRHHNLCRDCFFQDKCVFLNWKMQSRKGTSPRFNFSFYGRRWSLHKEHILCNMQQGNWSWVESIPTRQELWQFKCLSCFGMKFSFFPFLSTGCVQYCLSCLHCYITIRFSWEEKQKETEKDSSEAQCCFIMALLLFIPHTDAAKEENKALI